MSNLDIKNLKYERKEVGKTFPSYLILKIIYFFLSSRILYTWEFVLNNKSHIIQFWDSKLSGKKK